jgi:hypothetical protein
MPLVPEPIEFFTDRDSWIVKQKTKIILAIFLLFFVSMVMSCQELRYMVSGKTTDASLNTRLEYSQRNGGKYVKRVAGYSFEDSGKNRQRYFDVPFDWSHAEDKSIKVQYIPGSERSRVYGDSNKGWVAVFVGSLIAAVIGGIILAKSD